MIRMAVCSTGVVSAGGGPLSNRPDRQNVHWTIIIRTFCISTQQHPTQPFRLHMSATWAHLGINFHQQGPQLGPNFGPTSSTRLGATSAQVRSTLHQNGGHGRPDPKHSKNAFSLVFPHVVSLLGREAVKGSQLVPC